METTAIEKGFMQDRIKSRNYFLHTSIKISENFNIKYLRSSKTDLSKETLLCEIATKLFRGQTVFNFHMNNFDAIILNKADFSYQKQGYYFLKC